MQTICLGLCARDIAVWMHINTAFVLSTLILRGDSWAGSCQVRLTIRGETAAGGGGGEAYRS